MQSSTYMGAVLLLLLLVSFRGAYPERMIVWIIFLADLADLFYHRMYGPSDFQTIDYVHLVLDSSTFLAVLWVALGANRFWPLPVCALQLLGLTGHISLLAAIPGFTQVFWAMTTATDYVQLPIILIGILTHSRRYQRIGSYRDWRHDWRVPSFLQHPSASPAA